ncbi:MAG: HD domain-containing protein [Bacillota bacterium]
MERANVIRNIICKYIDLLEHENIRREEYIHSHTVAAFARLLASKRGLNEELALVIGYLHDIGRVIMKGESRKHGMIGALEAERILKRTKFFKAGEVDLIVAAIKWHSKKSVQGEPYMELIKDADTLAPYLLAEEGIETESRATRLDRIMIELNLDSI